MDGRTLVPRTDIQIRPRPLAEGARRLMLAVLEDAVECYRSGCRARDSERRRLFEQTREWLEADDDGAVFSFNTICHVLDLDPDAVRERLRKTPSPRPAARAVGKGRV